MHPLPRAKGTCRGTWSLHRFGEAPQGQSPCCKAIHREHGLGKSSQRHSQNPRAPWVVTEVGSASPASRGISATRGSKTPSCRHPSLGEGIWSGAAGARGQPHSPQSFPSAREMVARPRQQDPPDSKSSSLLSATGCSRCRYTGMSCARTRWQQHSTRQPTAYASTAPQTLACPTSPAATVASTNGNDAPQGFCPKGCLPSRCPVLNHPPQSQPTTAPNTRR